MPSEKIKMFLFLKSVNVQRKRRSLIDGGKERNMRKWHYILHNVYFFFLLKLNRKFPRRDVFLWWGHKRSKKQQQLFDHRSTHVHVNLQYIFFLPSFGPRDFVGAFMWARSEWKFMSFRKINSNILSIYRQSQQVTELTFLDHLLTGYKQVKYFWKFNRKSINQPN